MMEKIKYLKDYQQTDWRIESVDLEFHLDKVATIVKSNLSLVRQSSASKPIVLQGEELLTKSVICNGNEIKLDEKLSSSKELKIDVDNDIEQVSLQIEVEINPSENKQLMGLYYSGSMLTTQCEAEGFRRITWFYDRPDAMTIWRVKLIADKDLYPILLSNGNKVEAGNIAGSNKHYVTYFDPHPKPSYLFALVAGDLARVAESFTTMSGKHVELSAWVLHGNEEKAKWGITKLKNAMTWDERNYGREYDLEQFNIVSVPDFNMGAMENKSLNIFNDAAFLADKETATDYDYQWVDAVVAHEYFHNWTGNRITCRDWFQLCLKEGLTVYRDQRYSEQYYGGGVVRQQQVDKLMERQFPEDASALAHAARPSSFVNISNFYTVTVYEKGAEICRMLNTLLGDEAYRKGTDYYFEHFDNKAVTVEDFVYSFEQANNIDLSQFLLWYKQSGTPKVTLNVTRDGDYIHLAFTQELGKTKDWNAKELGEKQAQVIPIRFALIDEDLGNMELIDANGNNLGTETILILDDFNKSFAFKDNSKKALVSWNRGFSAPIIGKDNLPLAEKISLMACESDVFCRINLKQELLTRLLFSRLDDDITNRLWQEKSNEYLNEDEQELVISSFSKVFADNDLEPAQVASMLSLPSPLSLNQKLAKYLPLDIHNELNKFSKEIAARFESDFTELYHNSRAMHFEYVSSDDELNPKAMQYRSLMAVCAKYLASLGTEHAIFAQLKEDIANKNINHTIKMQALSLLAAYGDWQDVAASLHNFAKQVEDNPLVLDNYFTALAKRYDNNSLDRVAQLMQHKGFDIKNPNRLRAVLSGFVNNLPVFHASDATGYRFLANIILQVDKFNRDISSRWATFLAVVKRLEGEQQEQLLSILQELKSEDISEQLEEIIDKAINDR